MAKKPVKKTKEPTVRSVVIDTVQQLKHVGLHISDIENKLVFHRSELGRINRCMSDMLTLIKSDHKTDTDFNKRLDTVITVLGSMGEYLAKTKAPK